MREKGRPPCGPRRRGRDSGGTTDGEAGEVRESAGARPKGSPVPADRRPAGEGIVVPRLPQPVPCQGSFSVRTRFFPARKCGIYGKSINFAAISESAGAGQAAATGVAARLTEKPFKYNLRCTQS